MSLLVAGFGNHRADASLPQQRAVMPRGIGLVGTNPIRSSPRPPPTVAVDFQMAEQMLKHRTVAGLPGADEDHQGQASAIDELVDLGAQPAAGAPNTVVRRLDEEIRVIRPSPLCGV